MFDVIMDANVRFEKLENSCPTGQVASLVTAWGKVMFLHVSVSLFMGGGVWSWGGDGKAQKRRYA